MARRQKIDLMIGGTGNGSSFDWPGGRGVFFVSAASGGTVGLQMQAPDLTWIPVIHFATTIDIAIGAGKMANFEVPAGPLRAAAGAATGVTCAVVGVPLTGAG
jgi:hypothetical protein